MPTTSYNEALKDMIEDNPHMAAEMLEGALNSLLSGELDEGRLLLRQFVNATMGFQELAKRTGKIDKNLMRTLSAAGNPTASNLFEIVQACIQAEGVTVAAHVHKQTDGSQPQAGLR
jgi:DNA-binding phage protein